MFRTQTSRRPGHFKVVNSWLGQRDPAMDNAARLAQIKAHASEFAEPFRSATLAMPADTIVTYDTMAYWGMHTMGQ